MNIRVKKYAPKGTDLGLHGDGAGKGDSPRNCFSKEFKNNHDEINWGPKTPGKFRKTYR